MLKCGIIGEQMNGVVLITAKSGEQALIDEEDYPKVNQYTWHCLYSGKKKNKPYFRHSITGGSVIFLHRLVLDAPKGQNVDHINGDSLDNRKSNLRLIPQINNMQNRYGASCNSKTGIRGVTKIPNRDLYIARVMVNGKFVHKSWHKDIK
jgi:hypothetical protein